MAFPPPFPQLSMRSYCVPCSPKQLGIFIPKRLGILSYQLGQQLESWPTCPQAKQRGACCAICCCCCCCSC